MKKHLFIIFWVLSILHFAAAESAKTFEVSKVGNDKSELLEIFAAVQEAELRKGTDIAGVEVTYRVSSTEYLVYPMRKQTITWGNNRLGSGGPTRSFEKIVSDKDKTYFLITSKPYSFAKGDTSAEIVVFETGEVFDDSDREMLTGFGGVKVLKERVERITQQEFVERLRAGETWTLSGYGSENCRNCMGSGDLGKLKGNAKCPDCRGKGTVTVDCIVKW